MQSIFDSINAANSAVLSPQVIRESGAGKAYQAVAQSTAIAIQDAADYLRNMNTIATTATGVAMAQFLATGDNKYLEAVGLASLISRDAAGNFQTIGQYAAQVLEQYPSGG